MEDFKQIISPPKKIDDLIVWLRKNTIVTEIDLSSFSKPFLISLFNNAVNAITNQKSMANKEDLEFVCFKVEDRKYEYVLEVTHEEFIIETQNPAISMPKHNKCRNNQEVTYT